MTQSLTNELYVLLECATLEKSAEVDRVFARFCFWEDTHHPGPTETQNIYHLSNANVADVLAWCWSAKQLGTITHFQMQECAGNIANETRLVALSGRSEIIPYTMVLNDDTARQVTAQGRPIVWSAWRDVLEQKLREAYPNALFIPEEEVMNPGLESQGLQQG